MSNAPNEAKPHGFARRSDRASVYTRWQAMISRCTNPKATDFKYYGGRGITVCDRWRSFANFYEDMGDPPPGTSLDRIDNDKGYEKSNCRWADWKTQQYNKRTTLVVNFRGQKMTLREAIKLSGLSRNTVISRIYTLRWPLDRALSEPQHFRMPTK